MYQTSRRANLLLLYTNRHALYRRKGRNPLDFPWQIFPRVLRDNRVLALTSLSQGRKRGANMRRRESLHFRETSAPFGYFYVGSALCGSHIFIFFHIKNPEDNSSGFCFLEISRFPGPASSSVHACGWSDPAGACGYAGSWGCMPAVRHLPGIPGTAPG